ncbi:HlyD family secretion protein [Bradyrhizobium commune]|uniref:HlyD family secretion protein n=1 Tax=Bradyrhizobium commune TaxID=83627 RepID=A0A7S9D9Q9_9BRAD|nr:biotin/lipoyl-binding protein [Bradyrhizobium commune]QPF93618.1 HlyD family secretion protein [Bradyrhizobium commune]
MFELMICSLLTIVPDYLYRRYAQGKRFGKEITFFSVWYELRWGITGCLMLTVSLITMIFYFHPSTSSATLYFRTIPILPEGSGRVAEVKVGFSEAVKKGDVLFTLDASSQKAALETARRKVAEVDAGMETAQADLVKADAQIGEAKASYQQAKDELDTKIELQRRNANVVAQREIDKLQVLVDQRQAGIDAATAARRAAELQISASLPAQKASAVAARDEAQVAFDKTFIRAGVDGRVEQFLVRPGDLVAQIMRPAGILIPAEAGRTVLQAGFSQIEAQVMKTGMVAEATCISKPWVIIPMVITTVQDYIAAGQFRAGEQLIDAQTAVRPGTILVFLEPLYKGGLEGVTPGSSCIVNAYTSNHEEISAKETSTGRKIALHVVDGVGLVHALLLRIQALLLPIQTLVFTGH